MDSGKCKHHSDFFSFFFRFFRNLTCIHGDSIIRPLLPGRLKPRPAKFKGSRLSGKGTASCNGKSLHKTTSVGHSGQKRSLEKKSRPCERAGKKVQNRTESNYFLYLMAVPVSLTVTVLIPQMQFIL